MRNNIQNLTSTALMAAMLCIAGPVVIPVGMVPVSLVNMAIYLAIIILDKKKATISILIYLLIGFVGIPVFAGFTAGAGKLLGPTGGYLLGYPFVSWIAGSILEAGKTDKKEAYRTMGQTEHIKQSECYGKEMEENKGKHNVFWKNKIKIRQVTALAVGTVCLYFLGTVWLMYQSGLEVMAAVTIGVVPFVLFDLVKICLAIVLGNSIRHRL